MNSWQDFVNKLELAKKLGKNRGLSVPTIARLVYSGAFDSLIDNPGVDRYRQMSEDVKRAMKSTASLEKNKKKNDAYSLAEINNEATLAMWRHSTNPTSAFDMLESIKGPLKSRGFEPYASEFFKMRRQIKNKKTSLLTDMPSMIFGTNLMSVVKREASCELAVPGIIVSFAPKPTKAGKMRYMLGFFTGREYIENITVWPVYGEDEISASNKKDLAVNNRGIVILQPTVWNGYQGYNFVKWEKLV